MNRRTTLVLLAAGMGSRYGGVKQIDSIGPNGEAIIDYSIYDALAAGFTDICFIIRSEIEDDVREFFEGKFPPEVHVSYAVQSLDDIPGDFRVPEDRTKPWGTAHAVYAARHAVRTPFAVINADDFYGRDSFVQLQRYLSGIDPESTDFAMVGFGLSGTLSPHGTVSRGICRTDDNGYLVEVTEHRKIERDSNRIINTWDDGSVTEIPEDAIASMNIFGFTPAVFPLIEREFRSFLASNVNDPASEFYIPTLMTRLIDTGDARMQVLETGSRWFGMTYREDRASVEAEIRAFVDREEYPEKLWK